MTMTKKSFLKKFNNEQMINTVYYCLELLDELYLNGIITRENNLDSKTYIAKQLNSSFKTKINKYGETIKNGRN